MDDEEIIDMNQFLSISTRHTTEPEALHGLLPRSGIWSGHFQWTRTPFSDCNRFGDWGFLDRSILDWNFGTPRARAGLSITKLLSSLRVAAVGEL